MNFVAHQFLSFHKTEIQLGNLYGEIVRGKDYLKFDTEIQKGILLHREIDTFTDAHDIVKNSTKIFHPKYGKYAPVIVDVLYDHLLIKNWNYYTDQSYTDFVTECYNLFRLKLDTFPKNLKYIIQHLLNYDWFHNYKSLNGIQQTLKGISQRSKFQNNIYQATYEFVENEKELNSDFNEFFPLLINHCQKFIKS
ncbi:MAG: ACP phosphodiesterase [Moheibacter sp.]